ncbi:MAG: leucyl aminopeptidase [Polyangiaceae bacterium]
MPLKISVRSDKPLDTASDVVIVGVWASSNPKKPSLPEVVVDADKKLGGGLLKLLAKEEFTGKRDQTFSVATLGRLPAARLVLIGLGERNSAKDPEIRAFAAKAARAAMGEKAKSFTVVVPSGVEVRLRAMAEGLELGAYRFLKYFTGDRKPKDALEEASIVTEKKSGATAKKDIALGQQIAAGVNLSRDLSNEPSNTLTPAALAIEAQKMAKANGLKIQVFDYKEIQKRGMHLIDAVGRGSRNEPRFVHISYVPSKKAKKKLVFVGKGITFDSGGISIKPAQGMGEMKHDMSGAANMVGFMAAVAAVKPGVEVHALMACAENMPDGNAYRPGDVWGSLDGKSVEIINTDAEGRLVLADALAYAKTLEPDLLVDNATLTGACVVALGNTCSGWYANNEATANEFNAALKVSGEQMWRMPLLEELKEQLKSDVADIKHTGDRWGGSISAALFLREFIGTVKNWVHADIAGPATSDRATGWNAKGATGHGVLTFLALVERANGKK